MLFTNTYCQNSTHTTWTHTHIHTSSHISGQWDWRKGFWKEKGFQGRFNRADRGRLADRNRELVPDNWSLVTERALTSGLHNSMSCSHKYKQVFHRRAETARISSKTGETYEPRSDEKDSVANRRQRKQQQQHSLTLLVMFRASSILRLRSLILVERLMASRMFSWPSCLVVGRLVLTNWASRRASSAGTGKRTHRVKTYHT